MRLPAWLISPLPVRAARQRVGCEYAGNQFAFRMMLLFLARTYDCALALGMLAQAQWLYQVCCMRLRCTEICLYESYASIKTASYTGYSNAFSIDAIVRVPHGQGSKPHPSTVLLHHLARGNHFTAGAMSESLSLTLNQFEFVVGYRLSTQSFLCAYLSSGEMFFVRRLAGPRHISPAEV